MKRDNFIDICKDEAKKGDYAYVDGLSGFCDGGYEKILDISVRYNSKTGEPYKIVKTDSGTYRFDDGRCIKGALAYEIFSYHRKTNAIERESQKQKEKPKNKDTESKCLSCVYFGTEFCACIGITQIDSTKRGLCTKFLKHRII